MYASKGDLRDSVLIDYFFFLPPLFIGIIFLRSTNVRNATLPAELSFHFCLTGPSMYFTFLTISNYSATMWTFEWEEISGVNLYCYLTGVNPSRYVGTIWPSHIPSTLFIEPGLYRLECGLSLHGNFLAQPSLSVNASTDTVTSTMFCSEIPQLPTIDLSNTSDALVYLPFCVSSSFWISCRNLSSIRFANVSFPPDASIYGAMVLQQPSWPSGDGMAMLLPHQIATLCYPVRNLNRALTLHVSPILSIVTDQFEPNNNASLATNITTFPFGQYNLSIRPIADQDWSEAGCRDDEMRD